MAVHVLVITELLPVPLTVESEYVIVTSLSQLSVAVADPPVFAVLVVSTSHSTVISDGGIMVGSILSTTVTVCVAVAVLPEPSVTVHVTVVSPSGKLFGASFVVEATLQLSSVVSLPSVTPVASHVPASTFTVTAAGAVIVGSILSTTVTVCVA